MPIRSRLLPPLLTVSGEGDASAFEHDATAEMIMKAIVMAAEDARRVKAEQLCCSRS